MEKYGFVYIWYDRKHKRYYIGSHYGTTDDGYTCSSRWMRKSQRRRPQDFKRKILKYVYTSDRRIILNEEQRWLDFAVKNKDKGRYYNLNFDVMNPWWADEEKVKTISEKISKGQKPEGREKKRQIMLENNPMSNPDIVRKVHEKRKQGNHQSWNKGLTKDDPRVKKNSEGHSEKMKGKIPWIAGKKHSDEVKQKLSEQSNAREWYFNPETKHIIHPLKGSVVPEGYIRGRGINTRSNKPIKISK